MGRETLGIRGRIETIQNSSIVKIDRNTEKSPEKLNRLAVTQTPVKDHQLMFSLNNDKENDLRPSKMQHCYDRPEYWEESWRLGETCCHSHSNEKPSANMGVKNSQLPSRQGL